MYSIYTAVQTFVLRMEFILVNLVSEFLQDYSTDTIIQIR